MIGTLLAATLLATVPAIAATPEPAFELDAPAAPWPYETRTRIVIDGPAEAPRVIVWAAPAEVRRLREVRSETLLTVPRGTALEINNLAGTIVVSAWERNDVRITASHARRARLDPRLEHGTLSISVVGRYGEPAFGDMVVSVPSWMPLRLSGIETAIDVDGMKAAIDAGSVRGDVCVRRSRGPLQLRSVEGLVRVLDARGRVSVASLNNLVHLERVEGLIDAETVNGDIQLSDVESQDVVASTVNGSVNFVGPFQPRGRYRFATHNGNLRVGVPVGADVDVSVASFQGAFESGFPVQVAPHRKGKKFNFTLGGGGSTLELESFQGMIQLLRPSGIPAVPPTPPAAPRAPQPPQAPSQEDR